MKAVAWHFVMSSDYADFGYLLMIDQTLHAIHLNDVYSSVLKEDGLAWDSELVQYLLNASNYFESKHFASYSEVMLCV